MFENIGKKIKALCKIAFIVFSILSFIIGLVVGVPLMESGDEAGVLGFFLIILIGGGGMLFSYLLVMVLYGFGELVDTNQTQVKQNKKIISLLGGKKEDKEEEIHDENSSVKYFSDGKM